LQLHRPRTIGQAGRIDGVTPAALTLLVAYLRRARGSAASKPTRGAA
jgi:tRNA uridine 5-carboxymethylaminomethyl modification enzyme